MLKMPMIFGNGMVLQRQKEIAVWGTAEAGMEVTVTLSDEKKADSQGMEGTRQYGAQSVQTRADDQGDWSVKLPAGEAGRGLWMKVESKDEQTVFSDICIGEVWVAGGQSNMEYLLKYDADKENELAREANPDIRFFDYPEVSYGGQLEEFPEPEYGFWRQAEARQLPWFSAVGYYFARILEDKLEIPIGIVGCNWGGTPACAWQDPEGLRGMEGEPWLTEYEKATARLDMEQYWRQVKKNLAQTKGTQEQSDMAAVWERVMYPGLSREEQKKMMEQMAKMTERAAESSEKGEEEQEINLMELQPQNRPGGLYQTMLQKVAPFTARGVIWYQGESDENHAEAYAAVFGRMIEGWRALWQEELPFLFVQLAPFGRWLGGTGEKYPELRRQQERVSREVAHTWMASIGDAGMLEDIHPKHKRPVGERLAELALGHIYERPELCRVPGLCDAPELERAERISAVHVEDTYVKNAGQEEIRIYLRYGEGLHLETHNYTRAEPAPEFLEHDPAECSAKPDPIVTVPALRLYEIFFDESQSEQEREIPAGQIRLQENTLILPGSFPEQVEVRFAWEPYYEVNVYNAAGLPVKPSRIRL